MVAIGDPCSILPARVSCCDCVNLVKVGCIPYCRLTGQVIPFPNAYVCGYHQSNRSDGQMCRRCCGDPTCQSTLTHVGDCCSHGKDLNSCKGDGPPEANDIWAHMRCTSKRSSDICRMCDSDHQPVKSTDDCLCCRMIHQRANI